MFAFGLLATAVFRTAVEETDRAAAGGAAVPSVGLSGDFGRAVPLPLAFAERKGEAVRPTADGVPVLEGGLLGLLMAGLSHDEKKSSAGSPAGVLVPEPASSAASSMTTVSGDLSMYQHVSYPLPAVLLTSSGRSQPFVPAHPCTYSPHCSCTSSLGPC